MTRPRVLEIHTDGACRRNPGPGGWAYLILDVATGAMVAKSGFSHHTTNNRMEIMGILEALKTLKRPCKIKFFSDSQYTGKGLTVWCPAWAAKNFMKKGEHIKNKDLWIPLHNLAVDHEITYVFVKGHNGHRENEFCDKLATQASYGFCVELDSRVESFYV